MKTLQFFEEYLTLGGVAGGAAGLAQGLLSGLGSKLTKSQRDAASAGVALAGGAGAVGGLYAAAAAKLAKKPSTVELVVAAVSGALVALAVSLLLGRKVEGKGRKGGVAAEAVGGAVAQLLAVGVGVPLLVHTAGWVESEIAKKK